MPNVLTSWKEISQYLGKGVRTVQRWERQAGLPIRRSAGPSRGGVLALPEEIDEWARSRTHGPGALGPDSLRREMIALREETERLHERLALVEEEMRGLRRRPRKLAADEPEFPAADRARPRRPALEG